MQDRKIYWRIKKDGRLLIEGKRKNKTIFIKSFGNPYDLLKSLNLTYEKRANLDLKLVSLDIKDKKAQKKNSEVRTRDNSRTLENNDLDDEIDEMIARSDDYIKEGRLVE